MSEARQFLRAMFDAAVAAADPLRLVAAHLPARPRGRCIVVGAGKAAVAMARAVQDGLGDGVTGLVVAPRGQAPRHGGGGSGDGSGGLAMVEASHPIPDADSAAAAARVLGLVQGLSSDDLVIALISGGASALLALPAPGVSLADKQAVNRALLRCGASIHEINCVRKHLSAIKGGRLAAAAHPARVVTLLISDVPGDDPAVIGSGPTVGDPTTYGEAVAILRHHGITQPAAVLTHLARGGEETPRPDDPRLAGGEVRILATAQSALLAAASLARARGVSPLILGDAIEGEAREVGRVMAGIARQVVRYGQPAAAPCVLLSGGETTVAVRGRGRGGRNVEFLLALALALRGEPRVFALAADTDGLDGMGPGAGAIVTPETLRRGGDALARLDDNDGHGFFEALGDAVTCGPTGTNVNDFRAIFIAAPP